MTLVKICGITNSTDALNAITAGATYLGLIFVHSSARKVDEVAAADILQATAGRARTVAVFKNSSLDEIKRIASIHKFDFIQLHGSESPDFCRTLQMPVIKVIELQAGSKAADLERLIDSYKSCSYILFDKPKDLDFSEWLDQAIELVESLNVSRPYFFAGGLNHTNVRRVLNRVNPYALDVASGVEAAPGLKAMDKMIAFCDAVKDSLGTGANLVNEAIS